MNMIYVVHLLIYYYAAFWFLTLLLPFTEAWWLRSFLSELLAFSEISPDSETRVIETGAKFSQFNMSKYKS